MRLSRVLTAVLVSMGASAAFAVPSAAASAQGPIPPDTGSGTGYDIAAPQCADALPADASFVVLGVNGGRVFSANPCLGEQLVWAHQASDPPAFYANTANPGPLVSEHWPSGQVFPRTCASDYPANDSAECSYDYGWNAAEDSYNQAYYVALATYGGGAAQPDGDWWLDVETANTWQPLADGPTPPEQARANAVAALQGGLDYLSKEAGVRQVGLYSSATQWEQITGGTGDQFAAYPAWLAGAGDRGTALRRCDPAESFTGGPVTLVQYREGALDANVRCPTT